MEQLKNLATELTAALCNTVLSIDALPSFERDLKRLQKKKADKNKLIEVVSELANNIVVLPINSSSSSGCRLAGTHIT